MLKEKHEGRILVIYSLAFYSIWASFVLCLSPQITLLRSDLLAEVIKTAIFKNLVWTIPAIILVKHYNESVLISLKEMFTNKVNWLKYLPIFIVFTVYILIGSFINYGTLAISPSFKYSDLIALLFVGITEEMVFRGWLINASIKGCTKKQTWLLIILNAVMFLLIHMPTWIREGTLISNFANLSFLCILGLSILFSLAFIKSKSILVPISLHMYWDLLMFLFI